MNAFGPGLRLRALGGGPLIGDRWVRRIYIDEAGISQHEPVVVVAAVIVDADRQWRDADARLGALREKHLPEEMRQDFIFHAKSIFGNAKHIRPLNWSLSKRLSVIEDVIDIAHDLGLIVSLGWTHREPRLTSVPDEFNYLMAFIQCLSHCDSVIRNLYPDEVATVIAEDNPPMRKRLKNVPGFLRKSELPAKLQTITQIVDSIHFAEKDEASILQIADCCAFATRRYLAKQKFGVRLYYHLSRQLIPSAFFWEDRGGFAVIEPYVFRDWWGRRDVSITYSERPAF